jgi:release factor glutamine methyltransferase
MSSGMTGTIRQAIQSAVTRLQGIDTALLDAELLLAHVLGATRTFIMMYPERVLTAEQQRDFCHLLDRRAGGEPLAYLVGKQGFWTLDLMVTPDVLVPRPETELLVETALQLAPAEQPCQVLDLGTGSGAIALSIASERERWQVTATDLSGKALAIAEKNARLNKLTDRVSFRAGSWFDALEDVVDTEGRFDLIVSNPPYLADDDPHLEQGALPFEPVSALVAGDAGLADLQMIARQSSGFLKTGGYLLVEHGFEQGEAVRRIFHAAGFAEVDTIKDLAGLDRITLGKSAEIPGNEEVAHE